MSLAHLLLENSVTVHREKNTRLLKKHVFPLFHDGSHFPQRTIDSSRSSPNRIIRSGVLDPT